MATYNGVRENSSVLNVDCLPITRMADVPAGLIEMLQDFTVAVLHQRPSNLYTFAADYFNHEARQQSQRQLVDERVDRRSSDRRPCVVSAYAQDDVWQPERQRPLGSKTKVQSSDSGVELQDSDFEVANKCQSFDQKSEKPSCGMYVVVDDGECGEPELKPLAPPKYQRRRSVCAERFNPETHVDTPRIVHPKSEDQRSRLIQSVSNILLFRCLGNDEMQQVIDAMFERKVAPGEHVIEQGDSGDNFYAIERGTFNVYVRTTTQDSDGRQQLVNTFVDRGSFGELALMYEQPRSATVVAVTEGKLWAMDRMAFRQIVLKSAFRKRKAYEALLKSVTILESLNDFERLNLADALTTRTCVGGECIIKEGDMADGMYFVQEGQVRVTISKHGAETEVSRVDRGQYFGEMALVENTPRTASVYAIGDKVQVAFLERASFERLLGPCLDIMRRSMTGYQRSSK